MSLSMKKIITYLSTLNWSLKNLGLSKDNIREWKARHRLEEDIYQMPSYGPYIKYMKNGYKLQRWLTINKKNRSGTLAGSPKENLNDQQTCIKVLNLICKEENGN